MYPRAVAIEWLAGVQYYIPPKTWKIHAVDSVSESGGAGGSRVAHIDSYPCTLVNWEHGERFDIEKLQQKLHHFLKIDDVLCPAFLEHLLIGTPAPKELPIADSCLQRLFEPFKTRSLILIDGSGLLPPDGPYFRSSAGLRQAFRCYADTYGAFVTATVPAFTAPGSFEMPPTSLMPVPSRLYSKPPSSERPLSGLRVAVKDVIDMKGIRTTNCCRAYEALYPPRPKTARVLQRLIDLGAVVVGKTKTVQFASGAHPVDFFDVQCSFNPRGDGYQSPSMSSVGSATAVAGYDWLDFALGTDTFGSVSVPASATGLFALRPTWGIQDLDGVLPVSGLLDTVGFFTRNIELACRISKVWFVESLPTGPHARPTRIVWPKDLFPYENEVFEKAVETFVSQLAQFMEIGVAQIDLEQKWERSGRGWGKGLREYLHSTIAHIQLYSCFHNAAAFREEYEEKFGAKPFVDPVIAYKWSLGEALTESDYTHAVHEMMEFDAWVLETVVPADSKSLLVLPVGIDSPTYRDQYFASAEESGAQVQGFGFSSLVFPPLVGMPTFVIPIGQYGYMSKVSGKEELLPICVTITGSKGEDAATLELIKDFLEHSPEYKGSVLTGKEAFPRAAQGVSSMTSS